MELTSLFASTTLVLHVLVFLRISTTVRTDCTSSIRGKILRNHAYKSTSSKDIQDCYYECRGDELCQSINYYRNKNLCELNNRSASSTLFGVTPTSGHVFYFDNPFRVPLGSSENVPALSCQEIKKISSSAHSGTYWLDPTSSGKPVIVYCNMSTGAMVKCEDSPCQNGGTCHFQRLGQHTCTCPGDYTGAYCEEKVEECHQYTDLTEASRHETYKTVSSPTQCDHHISDGWYRFSGMAGDQIATSCVPDRHCGTDATGWLSGAHPSTQEEAVTRTVCFNWLGECCKWSTSVKVRDCGAFYLYKLGRPPGCDLRYCGSN